MLTIISFVSSSEILKEFCTKSSSFFSLSVEIKLFCVWILFIFKKNIFWIDALCKVKRWWQFCKTLKLKEYLNINKGK